MFTTTIDGKEVKYRGLTRREIKALKAEGFDLMGTDLNDDELIEKLVPMVCPDVDPDDFTPAGALALILEITQATFMPPGKVKNFVQSQMNILPGASATATNAKKRGGCKNKGAARK